MRWALTLLAWLLLWQQPAVGENLRKEAWAQVNVTVGPSVQVLPLTQNNRIGSMASEAIRGEAAFHVMTNEHAISLWAAVTHLDKAGLGQALGEGPQATRIPVDLTQGVAIRCDGAHPVHGTHGRAQYTGASMIPSPEGAKEGWYTEAITFQSIQADRFSVRCTVQAGWTQPHPRLPQGSYGGLVMLYAALPGHEHEGHPHRAVLPSR